MNRELSLSERIHNCAATQEVEFLHATHTYYHARSNATEEWSQIWAFGNPDKNAFDTCSWAHAFGRMRGYESVWYGSVTLYDTSCMMRGLRLFQTMPAAGGLDPRPLSEVSMHTLATDIIEVADDGKSARAFFLTPGFITSNCTGGEKRRAGGLWERYGADFIYDDKTNRWLFLHEHVCPDMGVSCDDANPGHQKYEQLINPPKFGPGGPGGPGGGPKPEPMIGPDGRPQIDLNSISTRPDCEDVGPLHNDWTPVQTVQNTVPWPEPYKTLDNEHSYTKNV